MYDPQLEKLVDMALEDGVITEKEKDILVKRAKLLGIDLDEFEMYLDSRLASLSNIQNTTPSQMKFGDLLKCPSCGASVPSLTIICKDCGFEFRNIKANSSVKEFSEKLGKATKTYSKTKNVDSGLSESEEVCLQIIESFPIPNTKDDLMEFAFYFAPKITTYSFFNEWNEGLSGLNDKYIKKYQEIILKAKVIGKDDPSFSRSIINLVESRNINIRTNFFFPSIGVASTFVGIGLLGSLMLLPILHEFVFNETGKYRGGDIDIRAKRLIWTFFITCMVLSIVSLLLGFKYRSKPVNWHK